MGGKESIMESERQAAVRRILVALGVSQGVAAANMAITFVAGSILLVRLAGGGQDLAGVPTAVILFTSSFAAIGIGRLKDARGYRFTLNLGYLSGIAAGILALVAARLSSLPALIAAMALVGLAMGAIMLCRFAAAEIHPPERRGKAISRVITGATVGAVSGPLLVNLAQAAGPGLGMPGAEAPFAFLILIYVAGLAASLALMRVEPRTLAYEAPAGAAQSAGHAGKPPSAPPRLLSDRAFALGSLFFAQVAMVFIMAVTPVHLHHHHHGMGHISFVITAHFLGMYGMSFLSGRLADRKGRAAAIALGSVTLIAACGLGAAFEGYPAMVAALFLLGMGWNLCFLSGTALVADSLKSAANRGRIQGTADAFVNVGSALASLSGGFFLEAIGFRGMSILGCAFAAVPGILVVLRSLPGRRSRTGGPVESPLRAAAAAGRRAG